MELYQRLYDYIEEYLTLVHDYYSKDAVAYLVTYYNINKKETIWDDGSILSGSYERIGELSGIKWDKYLLLPVFFIDEIVNIPFDATENGLIKNTETNIVIPYTYGIEPLVGDIIKFETSFLNISNDNYPLYLVTGIEISTNTEKRFWKLKLKVEQSRTTDELDLQISNTYVFFDFDKKIHTIEESEILTRILSKQEQLRNSLISYFNQNSGLYNFL